MFDTPTNLDGDISPWPPVLHFSPEVQSGIRAATTLAFGPETGRLHEDMTELDLEVLARDMIRYAPDLVKQLMAIGGTE